MSGQRSTHVIAHDRAPVTPAIPELAVVRLLHEVVVTQEDSLTDDWGTLPPGTLGTVVFVHAGGTAFELEVFKPFHALVTVDHADVAP